MDSFWFRANFGGMYKSDDFDGQISIRMWGPKLATRWKSGTTRPPNRQDGRGPLLGQLLRWKLGENKINLKLGHWKTDWSEAGNFGTYLDPMLGTRGFLMRDYSHDAFEAGWQVGPSAFKAMLATGDKVQHRLRARRRAAQVQLPARTRRRLPRERARCVLPHRDADAPCRRPGPSPSSRTSACTVKSPTSRRRPTATSIPRRSAPATPLSRNTRRAATTAVLRRP